MLHCPDCNHSLIAKKVRTHSGGQVEVDHCLFCHGVWFDHFEANQIPLPEIKKLTSQKHRPESAHPEASRRIGQNKCPHCLVSLTPLQSASIPRFLRVFTCPQCRGNWFSSNDLIEFKKAQKAKINYFKAWRLPLTSAFAVFLPLLIFALTIPVVLIGFKTKEEVHIRADEIIVKPTVINLNSTSVIVTWTTTQSVTAEIKYWTNELAPKAIIVSQKPVTNHIIELKNLSPQTFYFYQLILKDIQNNEIPSALYSFTTK